MRPALTGTGSLPAARRAVIADRTKGIEHVSWGLAEPCEDENS